MLNMKMWYADEINTQKSKTITVQKQTYSYVAKDSQTIWEILEQIFYVRLRDQNVKASDRLCCWSKLLGSEICLMMRYKNVFRKWNKCFCESYFQSCELLSLRRYKSSISDKRNSQAICTKISLLESRDGLNCNEKR